MPVARLQQLGQDYELALCVVTCPPDPTQNTLQVFTCEVWVLTVENAISSHLVCGQCSFSLIFSVLLLNLQ